LQQEARSFQHDFHHEVVLFDGIFDIFGGEEGGADVIFVKEGAVGDAG
jgi:hypothetical protein